MTECLYLFFIPRSLDIHIICRLLFKLAVEQTITMNVVAATCNIGREQLEKLRGTCVAQVKRSNGVYSFEDAFDFQKR